MPPDRSHRGSHLSNHSLARQQHNSFAYDQLNAWTCRPMIRLPMDYSSQGISLAPQCPVDLASDVPLVQAEDAPRQPQSKAKNVVAQPPLADLPDDFSIAHFLYSPPSGLLCSFSPLPTPRLTLVEDVQTTSSDSSSATYHFNQNRHLGPLAPEYHEEHHPAHHSLQYRDTTPMSTSQPSTSRQSAQIYPTQPPVESRRHSSRQEFPSLRHSRSGQVAKSGTGPPPMAQQPPLRLNQRVNQYPHTNQSMFSQARNFSLSGSVFIDSSSGNFTWNNVQISDTNFMTVLFQHTIPGAEFDSSDRNPPPRCHPGTRLDVIERCKEFILTCDGCQKLRWVVGAAGVGKSAIMQSVAENRSGDLIVGATVFYSIYGRQDGTKTILTIAYQLAVKFQSYHQFIQDEITNDPSLLLKSLETQFEKFIVEPVIRRHLLNDSSRMLIIVDGLDECDDSWEQRELLRLFTDFCISYPTSAVVWIIASRPEPHITSFFSQPKVAPAFVKEEILVNSDQAREDVERFLRDKFKEVQHTSIMLSDLPQWPSERDFLRIAKASDGLFAYASTVTRYIDDPVYGDPVSQLDDILEIVDTGTKENIPGKDHPMARLDALYTHIMSKIPADVMINTRMLLLLCLHDHWRNQSFLSQCDMLGITQHTGYGATHHIHSVAAIPGPKEAAHRSLTFFHKSFADYLKDYERSGFSPHIGCDVQQLWIQHWMRTRAAVVAGR